jgi:hypothetical protein
MTGGINFYYVRCDKGLKIKIFNFESAKLKPRQFGTMREFDYPVSCL